MLIWGAGASGHIYAGRKMQLENFNFLQRAESMKPLGLQTQRDSCLPAGFSYRIPPDSHWEDGEKPEKASARGHRGKGNGSQCGNSFETQLSSLPKKRKPSTARERVIKTVAVRHSKTLCSWGRD